MIYRPLGRTGLTLSAIGLGGHWRTADGRRYHDHFAGDEAPTEVLANRDEVVGICLDAGINYVDVTTAAECVAYGRVLSGRRDRFIIGADDYQWSARNRACLNVESLVANVERCLGRLRTDYLDIWRVTADVHGQNTSEEMATVIAAADRLRRAGKIRCLGVSSHHPAWLRHALESFAEFEVALLPTPPTAHPFRGKSGEVPGIGVIGIKPFAAGLLFATAEDEKQDNDTAARLAFRQLLHDRPGVACVVAGMSTLEEARNLIAAAEGLALTADEISWLGQRIRERLGKLPAEYAWLGAWTEDGMWNAEC